MTGAIACGQYSAVAAGTVQLHAQSVDAGALNATATATYAINSSGNVVGTPGGTLEAWLTGAGASSANYEVMATLSAGLLSSGTVGSWLNCGTNRTWSVINPNRDNSVLTAIIAVQIRDVATHSVQASASITLSAESDSRFG